MDGFFRMVTVIGCGTKRSFVVGNICSSTLPPHYATLLVHLQESATFIGQYESGPRAPRRLLAKRAGTETKCSISAPCKTRKAGIALEVKTRPRRV